MKKQAGKKIQKGSSEEVEWIFYRAVISMMGFLFLIQCLWANTVTVIFASSIAFLCLGYAFIPRGMGNRIFLRW